MEKVNTKYIFKGTQYGNRSNLFREGDESKIAVLEHYFMPESDCKELEKEILNGLNNYDKLKEDNALLLDVLKDFCDLRTAYSSEQFTNIYHKANNAIQKAERK